MTLGNIIENYRKENNISLREFAKKCGLSHGYIAMLEHGENPKTGMPIKPKIESLLKISAAMGYDIGNLSLMIDDIEINVANFIMRKERSLDDCSFTEGERMLVTLFRQVPVAKRNSVFDYLRFLSEHQE